MENALSSSIVLQMHSDFAHGFSELCGQEMVKMGIKILSIAMVGLFIGIVGCAEEPYRASKTRYQHPKWDAATINKVARRQVEPGMTGEMVRSAIGLPDSISRNGDTETWGYAILENDYQPEKKYIYFVYFDLGIVTKTTGDKNLLKTLNWYN